MKIALGFGVVVMFFWFLGPLLFDAMKKHDYDAMYHGMQDAKFNAGADVQEDTGPFKSYSKEYAYGRLRPEAQQIHKLTPEEKRIERRKQHRMAKWKM